MILNKNKKKKIAIITSGGDSSGMNQFIFTLKKILDKHSFENILIKNGFKGIFEWDIADIDNNIWGVNLNTLGGSIIGTSRFTKLKNKSMQIKIAKILKEKGITDLIILGGNGSYIGGYKLHKQGVNVILIPGTVDNDIISSDYSLGYDSSMNAMTQIIEQAIRSGISHNRFYIFELMSGSSSILPIQVGIAVSADLVLSLNDKWTEKSLSKQISKIMQKQKYGIMIVPDKFLPNYEKKKKLVNNLEKLSNCEIRYEIPGRVQRGARPTAVDRIIATKFANKVFDLIYKSSRSCIVAMRNSAIVDLPIEKAIEENNDKNKILKDLKVFERTKNW